MKKHRLKKCVKLGILLFGISFYLTNCQKDELKTIDAPGQSHESHGKIISTSKIPHILEHLSDRTNGTHKYIITGKSIRPLTSMLYLRGESPFGEIDTSKAIKVNNETNTKYSFNLVGPNSETEFINLIVVETNSELQDYFIKYVPDTAWLLAQGSKADMLQFTGRMVIYDSEGAEMGGLDFTDGDSEVIDNTSPCDEDDDIVDGSTGGSLGDQWDNNNDDGPDDDSNGGGGSCVSVSVALNMCCNDNPDLHPPSECGCKPPTGTILYLSYTFTDCAGSGGAYRTSSEAGVDPCNGNIGILIDEIGLSGECRKISDLLEENPEYKTKLLQLASEASTATFEKGVAIDKDGNDINIPDGVGGKIEPPLNPSEEYLSIAHIHDTQGTEGNGTVSVPTLNDLSVLGRIAVIENKLKLNKLVLFLFTADGTFYALTINSPSKFRTFWAYHKLLHGDATSLTQEQRDEYQDILLDRAQTNNNSIYHKYYENKNGSLIDETSTDYEQQLKYFLEFLQEEDGMGVSVFETDAQLSQFTEVKLNEINPNGTPQRNDCE